MDLDDIKQKLVARKAELLARMEATKSDLRREGEPLAKDFSEQATETENDEVLAQLTHDAELEIIKINRALTKIDKGTYHICSECGEEISIGRLLAVPFAEKCVNCANNSKN